MATQYEPPLAMNRKHSDSLARRRRKSRQANNATRSGASGTKRKASRGPRGIPRQNDVQHGGAEGTGGNDGSRCCASPRLKRPSAAKIGLRRIMDDEGLDESYTMQHARRRRDL